MLKTSGIAWENREFESYPFSCSTVSQQRLPIWFPPFISFQTVYKCWQNLPALVEVSLHLNSFFGYKNFILCFNSFFWVQNFYALFILIWDALFIYLFIYFRLFVFVFILFEHPWQPHTIDVVADDQGRGSLQYWRRAKPVNNVSERRSRD